MARHTKRRKHTHRRRRSHRMGAVDVKKDGLKDHRSRGRSFSRSNG